MSRVNRHWHEGELTKLRPVETVEAHEWARLERARRTTDPRKLAAMLPGWLKAHMRQSLTPVRAVFCMRTYVPFAGTRVAADVRKLADFPSARRVEQEEMTTAQYVRELEKTWSLRHVRNTCERPKAAS